ncbi:MAG TPA: ribokinase [Puia sp.]|jgi:ribokinase|nr:ribokinase [Puia sp.]
MTKPTITVIGSSNTDMVIKADHLPGPGETIIGGTFFMNPGGKGANQAVAAARLGGKVSFICKTGDDIFGSQSLQLFKEEGINTSFLISDPDLPSGVALIIVDKNAENCIAVASGANAALKPSELEHARELIFHSSIILLQLEIPLDTVSCAAAMAFEKNIPVVLNPAPACTLPDELLSHISILTPNKTEAGMLSGIRVHDMESAKEAAEKIKDRGVKTVIITLGNNGALVLDKNVFTHIPASPVTAVDTTAAGDTFNGALVVALSEGKDILQATAFASKASAISVTRIGAQASIPYKHEVDAFTINDKKT